MLSPRISATWLRHRWAARRPAVPGNPLGPWLRRGTDGEDPELRAVPEQLLKCRHVRRRAINRTFRMPADTRWTTDSTRSVCRNRKQLLADLQRHRVQAMPNPPAGCHLRMTCVWHGRPQRNEGSAMRHRARWTAAHRDVAVNAGRGRVGSNEGSAGPGRLDTACTRRRRHFDSLPHQSSRARCRQSTARLRCRAGGHP